MSTWTFAKTLARKKKSPFQKKNFSRDCSLHTQRLTQRKPLSWTFCSTLISYSAYSYDFIHVHIRKLYQDLGTTWIHFCLMNPDRLGSIEVAVQPSQEANGVTPYSSQCYSKNLTWETYCGIMTQSYERNLSQLAFHKIQSTTKRPETTGNTSENDDVLCIYWSSKVLVEHRTHTERCFHCAWQEKYPSDCDTSMTGIMIN